jgi:ABC-2 type transport system ATP-binding protein
MTVAISIRNLEKTYANGLKALDNINLDVQASEIFALLGPNGAGTTTLISAICGIVKTTAGSVEIFGQDTVKNYRQARASIGLVPQELTTDAFETVWNTVSFTRGLFGKAANPAYIETLLKDLSLWDKKDSQIRSLSGGMKRRVLIAKALSHEPKVLFLDEPSAGVDVELRKSMWEQVRQLRATGVTVILTTHYIEEAEEMADRIGVINKGKLIVTEDKNTLMKTLGKKEIVVYLDSPLTAIPGAFSAFDLQLANDGTELILTYDPARAKNGVVDLMDGLKAQAIRCTDVDTRQSSLEEIFVKLIGEA